MLTCQYLLLVSYLVSYLKLREERDKGYLREKYFLLKSGQGAMLLARGDFLKNEFSLLCAIIT